MAHIQKRPDTPDKPWTVRWSEGGRKRRRSFRLKSEADAQYERALATERAEREGRFSAPAVLLNRTLDRQWSDFRYTREHLSDATRDKDEWIYRKWLSPTLGNRTLGSITHHDLNKLLSEVSASGAGPDTRIAVYQRLCMLLDDALGPEHHTCRQAKAGTSKRKREIRVLTDDEIEKLLAELPEGRDRLLCDVIATMGLRPVEALSIRPDDLGVEGGMLLLTIRSTKNDKTRTLPVPERLRNPLVLMARPASPSGSNTVFDVTDYRTWRRRVFKPAAERAGVPSVVPYDLRHSCASKLISKGATPTDVAEWMGHSVEMTLRTYSHLFPGRKTELAALLDR